jgi:hypothetical protein
VHAGTAGAAPRGHGAREISGGFAPINLPLFQAARGGGRESARAWSYFSLIEDDHDGVEGEEPQGTSAFRLIGL